MMVSWIDAQSAADWEEVDTVKDWAKKKYEVVEVGWEICENDVYTVICSQIGNDGSLGNKTKIPNNWITKKRVMYGQRNRTKSTPIKKDSESTEGREGGTGCTI